MLAYVEMENELGPHGVPMSVATDPRADPGYYGEDAIRFRARGRMDWAQHSIVSERNALLKDDPNLDISSMRFVVEQTDFSGGAGG